MSRSIIITILSIAGLAAFISLCRPTTKVAAGSYIDCQYVITPATQSFPARGGNGNFSVLTQNNCAWTAASNAPWITITSANSGSGLGRVNYSVATNPDANQRSGTITIAGQTFTVAQAGTSGNCTPIPISIGQTVNGALTTSDCRAPLRIKDGERPFADRYSFNGTSGQPVIISLSSASFDTYLYLLGPDGSVIAQNDDGGSGSGSRIPAGTGFFTPPASGTFIIEATSFSSTGLGNYTLSLTAPAGGCTYAINATSQPFPAGGGTGLVNISTSAGCAWTAMSNMSWVKITAGSSGSGPSIVNYTVAANTAAARAGTMIIAGLTFTVSQAGAGGTICPTVASINPSSGAAGTSVMITGTNFTGVTAVKFNNNLAAQFQVVSDTQITATVPSNAVSGPITLSKPNCVDLQTATFTVSSPLAVVSAASYNGASLASEEIAALYGVSLATTTQLASTIPLPTALAGTTVKVKDNAGTERLAPLFFVSPGQINYEIPPGTTTGVATVTVMSGDGHLGTGTMLIATVAPGLFAANANGQGVAAAVALPYRNNQPLPSLAVAQFDPTQNKFVSVPIDLGPDTDLVFLVLYGTGIRFNSGLSAVSAKLGGVDAPVSYANVAPGFVGLDQVNVLLPRSLIGRGEVDVVLTVDGKASNTVRVNIK